MGISQVMIPAQDFHPKHIFECGQCFRWNPVGTNSYIGVANGKVLKVSLIDKNIVFEGTNQEEFETIWETYFDLNTDYNRIKACLSDGGVMDRAIKCGGGIRILKQDLWETILSFIISSNNNIPRIKKIIEILCETFGEQIHAFGKSWFAFPGPERLKGICLGDLSILSAGYRDRYLMDAVQKVNSGTVNLRALETMDYCCAKRELMKINGIGPKVADCIALFGLGKREAFPVDVWIRRVLDMLYHKECSAKQAAEFADNMFCGYAGVAQQYLFYYIKENYGKIKEVC